MSRDISLHKTSLCGYRPSNEDVERYNMNLSIHGNAIDPNFAPIDFFVVCDGHGGISVAEFIAPKLEKHLMKKNLEYPLTHNYICKVYNYIQQELVKHPKNIARACGCTALVLIRYMDAQNRHKIQIINLGDCRAVLSRKGLAIPLSKDHKPYWSDEKRRIQHVNEKYNTNEKVHFDAGDWRIGDLSVSRSFGDLDNTPYLSHIPDTFDYLLTPDDEFIVLGCDGLYDFLENHEVVNFVRDHIHNNHTELYRVYDDDTDKLIYPTKELNGQKNIARLLGEFAIANKSSDNISVMIIFIDKK